MARHRSSPLPGLSAIATTSGSRFLDGPKVPGARPHVRGCRGAIEGLGGVIMVAKCSNPTCNREFRELNKGRLYLLPPTEMPFASWGRGKLSDYCYWLCPECDVTHTVERYGSEVVFALRD